MPRRGEDGCRQLLSRRTAHRARPEPAAGWRLLPAFMHVQRSTPGLPAAQCSDGALDIRSFSACETRSHVRSARSLVTSFNVEFDRLPFRQAVVPRSLESRPVKEELCAI